MKKLLALSLCLAMFATACSTNATATTETTKPVETTVAETEAKKEKTVVRWNYGSSGNVFVNIAEEKGYFDEEGIVIEPVAATAVLNALGLLSANQVDVVSNAGTSNPLQQIAAGNDFTIFGGHMVNGAMPVIAKKGTEWKGVESLVGEKVAINPSYFAFPGALMEKGYDDPLHQVEWITFGTYDDALAAVQRGEVKYALMPNYSCCRMECQTKYLKENPETIKAIIRALLRAQCYYESHKDEAIELTAKKLNTTTEFVSAYMNNPHYFVSVDPLRNQVKRAWGILDKTNFLDENAKNINIDEHINTSLYEEALKEAKVKYGAGNEAFYEKMEKFFDENDR